MVTGFLESPVVMGRRDRLALLVWLPLAMLLWVNIKCVIVHGHSMEPTFHTGQIVLVWKAIPAADLKPGDVIVFRGNDGVEMIKRIVLITREPMERVRSLYYTHDAAHTPEPLGLLFAPYLAARDMGQCPPPTPDQDIYMVGDNFNDSYDSRDYGPIGPRQILGRVIF